MTTIFICPYCNKNIHNMEVHNCRDQNMITSNLNEAFLKEAKSYDSPSIIRQLVERVKELEKKLEKCEEEMIEWRQS